MESISVLLYNKLQFYQVHHWCYNSKYGQISALIFISMSTEFIQLYLAFNICSTPCIRNTHSSLQWDGMSCSQAKTFWSALEASLQ